MSRNNCLTHCTHWAGGKCRLENVRSSTLGVHDCPHFDQRVALRSQPETRNEL